MTLRDENSSLRSQIKKQAKNIVDVHADTMLPNTERYNELQGIIEQALLERHNKSVEMCANKVKNFDGFESNYLANSVRALKEKP